MNNLGWYNFGDGKGYYLILSKGKFVGDKLQEEQWSIQTGDYKRRSDGSYRNMDEIRKRGRIKRIIITIIFLIIAFCLEFFVLRQIAKM